MIIVRLKRIVACICVMTILIGVWEGLNFLVNDDTKSYTRVAMHEFYNLDNVDTLFCGGSLCYRSFNTEILDEKLDASTFNLGTSAQELDGTYYLIKEAVNQHDVQRIFLEVGAPIAVAMDVDGRTADDMTSTYIISDYMKPSLNKLDYLLHASKPDSYVNTFLIARRNWEKLFDYEYVAQLIDKKSDVSYIEYGYDNLVKDSQYYVGKGYVVNEGKIEEHSFYDQYGYEGLDIEEIDADWFDYLYKIIEYCEEKDVELVLLCSPLSQQILLNYSEGYDEYHDMLEQIANDAELEFWDFNLCKEDYMPIENAYYKDTLHLNKRGAEVFSTLFAEVVSGDLDFDEICYASLSDKLSAIGPTFWGVTYSSNHHRIVANEPEAFEFYIMAYPDDGEEYLIQDFSSNIEFDMTEKEHGRLHIVARQLSNGELYEADIMY